MKKILSLLMCYVFLQAETFALRGGPGGGGGPAPLQGAYSAILIQSSPLFDIFGRQVGTTPGTGLGLVTLSAPSSGPATGNLLIFDAQTGNTFLGKANGLSNVRTGELTCLVSGTEFVITTSSLGTGTAQAKTTTQTISGRLLASRSKLKKTSSEIVGSAVLTVSGIPFIDLATGRTFVGNGQPTTYDLVGYLTGSSDVLAATFDLTVSN